MAKKAKLTRRQRKAANAAEQGSVQSAGIGSASAQNEPNETVWSTVFVDRTTDGVWEEVFVNYMESSQKLFIFFNTLRNKEQIYNMLRSYPGALMATSTGDLVVQVPIPSIGQVAVTQVGDEQIMYDFSVVSFSKVFPDFALITRCQEVKDIFNDVLSSIFVKNDLLDEEAEELARAAYEGLKRPEFYHNAYKYDLVSTDLIEQFKKLNNFLMACYIMESMPNIAADVTGFE